MIRLVLEMIRVNGHLLDSERSYRLFQLINKTSNNQLNTREREKKEISLEG